MCLKVDCKKTRSIKSRGKPGFFLEDNQLNMEAKEILKIVCISDTHCGHDKLKMPEGDVLIHAGDFTYFGKPNQSEKFNEWLGTLPYKYKVVVAGNHENGQKSLEKELTNAIFLSQSETVIFGLKFYGTKFFWKCPTGNPYFDLIPVNTDILISHGPPEGYFDGGHGCPSLLKKIKEIKPKLHVFGHVHSAAGNGRGRTEDGLENTIFVNAANCAEEYSITRDPVVVEVKCK
jgi:Icc-related predicted phosphoesterase